MHTFIEYGVNAVSLGAMYALMALGIALLFGVARIVNFAYGELIMIGGYVLVVLAGTTNIVVVVIATLGAAILVSVLMERVAFRPVRGAELTTLLITSFAVSFLLQNIASLATGAEPKAVHLPGVATETFIVGQTHIAKLDVGAMIAAVLVLGALVTFMKRSTLGVELRATAENYRMARVVGVRANRVISVAFAISGVLAGVVAIFVVAKSGFVSPTMGLMPLLIAFVGSVLGGMDRFAGAAVGGFVLGVATVILQASLGVSARPFRDAIVFALVIVVLLVRPEGLMPRHRGESEIFRTGALSSLTRRPWRVRRLRRPVRARCAVLQAPSLSVASARRAASRAVGFVWPLAVLAAILVAASLLFTAISASAAVTMLINVIFVVGLYVFVGNSGILSFGHASFMLLGGYTAALMVMPVAQKQLQLDELPAVIAGTSLSPTLTVLVAGLVAAVAAAVVGIPLMRLAGLQAAIATVALLVIVNNVASNWTAMTNGFQGLFGIPSATTYGATLVWAVVAVVIALVFQTVRVGLRLRASRADEIAARSLGVSVTVERWTAFVVSAFITGIGAALFVMFVGTISPNTFSFEITFLTLAMLIVGGINTLSGAVIGPILISLVVEGLRALERGFTIGGFEIPSMFGLQQIVLSILLLTVLIVRRAGLTGGREIFWLTAPLRALYRRSLAPPMSASKTLDQPQATD